MKEKIKLNNDISKTNHEKAVKEAKEALKGEKDIGKRLEVIEKYLGLR